jgi:peptidoglycan/LPS O-acetylase OafA/YrhL
MHQPAWRFTHFDLGRALACLMVVAYHAAGTASLPKYFGEHALSDLMTVGYVRMPFFFAMSGFLLSWLYLKPQVRPGTASIAFLFKRLCRIFPVYWFVLCCVAAIQIFALHQPEAVPRGWDWFETAFLLPQNPAGAEGAGGTGAPVLYPAWVLQYELAGYCLLALALWRPVMLRAYLLGFPLLYVWLNDSEVFLLSFLGSNWLLIFWMGAIAAWAARDMDGRHRSIVLGLGLVWLLGAGLTHYFIVAPQSSAAHPDLDVAYGLGFALLMIGLSRYRMNVAVEGQRPVHRGIERLSAWSYAIFICHAPVISLVCKLLAGLGWSGNAGWVAAMVCSMGASIALGALLYRVVEQPVDRWIKQSTRVVQNWWARRPSRAPRGSSAARLPGGRV